jgi:hypothetical protein
LPFRRQAPLDRDDDGRALADRIRRLRLAWPPAKRGERLQPLRQHALDRLARSSCARATGSIAQIVRGPIASIISGSNLIVRGGLAAGHGVGRPVAVERRPGIVRPLVLQPGQAEEAGAEDRSPTSRWRCAPGRHSSIASRCRRAAASPGSASACSAGADPASSAGRDRLLVRRAHGRIAYLTRLLDSFSWFAIGPGSSAYEGPRDVPVQPELVRRCLSSSTNCESVLLPPGLVGQAFLEHRHLAVFHLRCSRSADRTPDHPACCPTSSTPLMRGRCGRTPGPDFPARARNRSRLSPSSTASAAASAHPQARWRVCPF